MSTRRSEASGAHVLIPVKHLAGAKSRFAPNLGVAQRKLLALAMLEDTVRAAGSCPAVGRITVVTPDESAADHARSCGALVLAEAPPAPDASPLNSALDAAAKRLQAEFAPATLVVLQADLPALRAAELSAAIADSAGGRAIVADHSGTGTTALIVPGPGAPLNPRFGPWSALEHQRGGALALVGDWPGLRSDVDTASDLRRVLGLGVGPATAALLASLDDIDWNTA